MILTKQEAFDLTKRVVAVFDVLGTMRRDSSLVLALHERGEGDRCLGATEAASTGVSNLAFVVAVSSKLRESLTDKAKYFIGAAIQRSNIERLSIMPIERVCCHEMAVPVATAVWMEFRSLLATDGGFELSPESWHDPEPLDALAKRCIEGDAQSASHVLAFLIEAVDATGFTVKDFDLLRGMAKREGVVIADALSNADPIGKSEPYPWPEDYGRDLFIWEEMASSTGIELEIKMENQKSFQAVGQKRMKQIALRYAVAHGSETTRIFNAEREITDAEREKVLAEIRRVTRHRG
tara:strand:- start:614 stop:1495 length:882 start_codon:yes stop_codon:yes gene_type:complete